MHPEPCPADLPVAPRHSLDRSAPDRPALEVVGSPSPAPSDLRVRAAQVLEHVLTLERELLFDRALRMQRISTVSAALHELQLGLVAPSARRLERSDLADLRAAQRCVADAQLLTLDLIERLQPIADAG